MRGNGHYPRKEAGGSALTVDPAARFGKYALLRSGQDGLKFFLSPVAQVTHLLLQVLDLGGILGLDLVQLLFLLVSEPELGVPGRHAVRHIGGSRLAGRLRGGATVRGSGSRSIG